MTVHRQRRRTGAAATNAATTTTAAAEVMALLRLPLFPLGGEGGERLLGAAADPVLLGGQLGLPPLDFRLPGLEGAQTAQVAAVGRAGRKNRKKRAGRGAER